MAELIAHAVSASVRERLRLHPTDLVLRGGELVAVIGPNGAGKSSLLAALAGAIPHDGTVTIGGKDLAELGPAERARLLAWMPQQGPPAWPVRVADAVALGRFAYGREPHRQSALDRAIVDQVIADCDLGALVGRTTVALSGGELARVHLARTLATAAPILLVDEPTAALDPAQSLAIMAILARRARAGLGVLAVMHDVALAARYASRMVAMADGRIVADGPPAEVLTPSTLGSLFNADVRVTRGEDGFLRPEFSGAATAAGETG